MHEMTIAENLIDLIQVEALAQSFSRVRRVGVQLGALGHVEPEALLFCFDAVAQGSVAEGAVLAVEIVAGSGWCPGCEKTVAIAQRYDLCPICGQTHVKMIAGDALRLTELEVE